VRLEDLASQRLSRGNDINSNNLLAEVRYPDKTTGNPGTVNSDKVRYTYNALGQPKTMTDQNGSAHAYSYDVVGRMTARAKRDGSNY